MCNFIVDFGSCYTKLGMSTDDDKFLLVPSIFGH